MRIVLAPDGSRGDVHPLLALGSGLKAAGHQVRVCAPPDFEADAREAGFEFHPVGASVRDYLAARADVLERGGLAMLGEARRYFGVALRAQFDALPAAVADADFVFGAGVQLAAPSIAELHGVPYRYVVYCPILLPSAEHPPPILTRQTWPRWVNRLAWRAFLGLQAGVLRRMLGRERARLGLGPVRDSYRHLLGPRPVLAADAGLAPVPADTPIEVTTIPSLQPLEGEALPPKLEAFLASGPAPVYFGFGSMTARDPERTTRTLLAAVAAAGCRAVVAEGWAGLGAGALPEGVLPIGPVSHAALFPRLAAVVHHGGAGTTATAARAGVPQIVVPHVLDQFYWAARVARLGLGPPAVPRRHLRAELLAVALAQTLENEILAERTRELGERLRARAFWANDAARRLVEAGQLAPTSS